PSSDLCRYFWPPPWPARTPYKPHSISAPCRDKRRPAQSPVHPPATPAARTSPTPPAPASARWDRPCRYPRQQNEPGGGRYTGDPHLHSACGRTNTTPHQGPTHATIYATPRSDCSALPDPCRTALPAGTAIRTERRCP